MPKYIKNIEESIIEKDYNNLFTIIKKYQLESSQLEVRNIDILLHYVIDIENHEENIIRLLETMPREIIIEIFNDDTVKYPYPSRKYLNNKKSSTLSSILVSQFINIYYYLIIRYPELIINEDVDLKLILNQLLGIYSQRQIIHKYDDIYKDIIRILKRHPKSMISCYKLYNKIYLLYILFFYK